MIDKKKAELNFTPTEDELELYESDVSCSTPGFPKKKKTSLLEDLAREALTSKASKIAIKIKPYNELLIDDDSDANDSPNFRKTCSFGLKPGDSKNY